MAENTLKRAEFRGNAGEYFGIWIVNILLTIVTFGIYSAWAKVRRMRYFRGNTFLDGYSFDYHARGLQIFLGRAIVFIIFAMVNVVTQAVPLAGAITPFVFAALLPFFIVRSFRFNARVTSYRNVRFDFTGNKWGAFTSIILGGVVSVLTLGILAPLASRWASRYIFNHLRYGDRPFSTDPKLGAIYRALIPPAVMVIVGLVVMGFVALLVAYPMLDSFLQRTDDPSGRQAAMFIILAVYGVVLPLVVIYAFAGMIYRVAVRNIVVNAMLFDGRHQMRSDLKRLTYVWIWLSNTVVTLLTLGLMRPWAAVREQRYMLTHTGIIPQGEIGDVVGAIQASGSAIGSEYMDLEGFDFGF